MDNLMNVLGDDIVTSFTHDARTEILQVYPLCPIHGQHAPPGPQRSETATAVFAGGHRDGETIPDPSHEYYRVRVPAAPLVMRPTDISDYIKGPPVETYRREGLDDWGRRIYRILPR